MSEVCRFVQGVVWRLRDAEGKPIEIGEVRKDYRGKEAKVMGGSPPHRDGTSGYVWVEIDGSNHEYYASTYDLYWTRSDRQ